jgi:hypothetical protein
MSAAVLPPLPFSRGRRLATWVGVGVLLLSGLVVLTPDRAPVVKAEANPASFNGVVHWQDASHDWLIVADRGSDQLVVYDARDGRPLRRIGAREGLTDIETLATTGERLLVAGDSTPEVRVVSLPSLQLIAATDR